MTAKKTNEKATSSHTTSEIKNAELDLVEAEFVNITQSKVRAKRIVSSGIDRQW